MGEPYNYTSGFAGLQSPADAFITGIKNGAGIQQVQAERAAYDLKQQQAEQMRADLAALSQNPTTSGIAAMSIKYPQLSEGFKRSYDMLEPAKKQAKLESATQIYAAMENGRGDLAKDILKRQAEAARNSGDEQEARAAEAHMQLIDTNPNLFKMSAGKLLAAAVGPDKFSETFGKIGAEQRAGELQRDLVRKGSAEAAEAESEVALKNLGIVAQKAGALAKPGVKPAQAQTMFRTLAAQGVIPKEELQGYLDGIPADPKALPEYMRQVQAAGLSANEQRKFTDVDANTAANNATQIKTTSMNNATTLAVQDRIAARQEAKGDVEATLDADTLQSMAEQYVLGGDKTVLQNLGRGAQGSANLVALRGAISRVAKEQGMSGAQIAAKLADFEGLKAGLRTSANISARVENAIAEAKELAPLAIEAGRQVSRSGFLPFGKAQVMFNTQTNDPAMKKFAAANVGFVTAYAGAMARGQKPTVHDKEHAEKVLSEATSQEAYEATMEQLMLEMEAASRAPQNVRQHLRNEIGGKGHGPAPAVSGQVIDFGSLR